MMRDYVKEKVLARGKKVSIGIDVHKESWQVTAISEGEELFHGRMPADYSALGGSYESHEGLGSWHLFRNIMRHMD